VTLPIWVGWRNSSARGKHVSESRRKEFGGKACRVWAEVIKAEEKRITVAFGSESETASKEERDRETVLHDTGNVVEELKRQIDEAHSWAKVNITDMMSD
jgi:hypothetical protein